MGLNHIIAALLLLACGIQVFAASSVIEAGRILDVRSGSYASNRAILVDKGRIREIGGFDDIRRHAPKDAQIIDLRNATVLPGIIDCHAHLLAAVDFRLMTDALTVAVTQMSPAQGGVFGARHAH